MKTKLQKGTYGYLDKNKKREWTRAIIMLSVPIIIFIAAWIINGTRMNVMTVVAICGCLPGCNQVVRAIMASRYHSIDQFLYEETEAARGECPVLYENVFTSYEKNFFVDCLAISGREIIGYASDTKMNTEEAAEHIRTILQSNAYKQNVKIVSEKRVFLERLYTFASLGPAQVPFEEDKRYPGMSRDEIIQYILMAISL